MGSIRSTRKESGGGGNPVLQGDLLRTNPVDRSDQ